MTSIRKEETMGCIDKKIGSLIGGFELGILSDEEKLKFEQHLLLCQHCFDSYYRAAPIFDLIKEKRLAPAENLDQKESAKKTGTLKHYFLEVMAKFFCKPRLLVVSGALVVVVAALLTVWSVSQKTEDIRLRGGDDVSILVLSPVGDVSIPGELRWKAVADVRFFTVKIYDAKGVLFWEHSVEGISVPIPESIQEKLIPKQEYFWQVQGRTGKKRILKSQVIRFRIR